MKIYPENQSAIMFILVSNIFASQGFLVHSVPHKCGVEWTGNPYTWLAKMVSKGSFYKKNRESSGSMWWHRSQLPANINVDQLKQRHFNHIETFFKSGSRKNLRICFQLDMHFSIWLLSKKKIILHNFHFSLAKY